jgi:diguanylate cyclase (GGDEF)-like protein
MKRLCRAVWILACAAAPGWAAVGVTPEMLDVERNPVVALASARQALDALPPPSPQTQEKRLEWQLQATFAAVMLGDQPGYQGHLLQADRLAKETHDAYAQALLTALRAGRAGESGRPQEAIAAAREAAQLAQAITDPLSRAFVRDMTGWALLTAGQFAEAEPHFRVAIEAYVASGARLRLAAAQAGIGTLFEGLRDLRSAYRERQAAYEVIREMDAPYLKSYLAWSLGKDALQAAEPQKAREHFEVSVRESRRMKDYAGVSAAAEQGLGMAAADLGQWAEAIAILQEVQPRLLAKQYMSLWSVGQAALARAQVESGRGDGEATLAVARPVALKMGDSNSRVQFLEREAGVMRAAGRFARAADLLGEALEIERRLFGESRQTQLSELMVRYNVYKQQVENNELRVQKELADARYRQQQASQHLLVTVLVLGTAAGALLVWTLRQQVRSRRHFSELAATDVLTGSPNRRAILERLGTALAAGAPAMVCMLDIDHFKRINDQHGHPVGDLILKDFYQACTDEAGDGEQVGRLGGEEWLLIAQGVGASALQPLFDRIRRNFHQRASVTLPQGGLPTFSMGVCPLKPGLTVSESLARVDAALYSAKSAGRDGWVLQDPEGAAA